MKINFDEMVKLYKEDPKAFEAKRIALIEEFITSCPKERQQRLRETQKHVDEIRSKAKDEFTAALEILNLARDSLSNMNESLQYLNKFDLNEKSKIN